MKRRTFLRSSLAVAGVSTVASLASVSAAEKTQNMNREFYELRRYQLRRGSKQKAFDEFYKNAAIPAMNRAGSTPIGVFSVAVGQASPSMYVIIPHKSIESFATSADRLFSDAEYQKAGADFINAPPTEPSYVRVESWLLRAFSGMPRLELPSGDYARNSRVFELRTYESHSKKANRKKIEMFNEGEIAIFRHAGLQPIFFGETIIGSQIPNLTYLLVYEDMASRDKHWGAFGSDPEWKKLSSTPGYTDPEIVSNISNQFLRPTSYSQI